MNQEVTAKNNEHMEPFVDHIRLPEEVRKLLVQINDKTIKHGRFENGKIILPRLTKRQNAAKGLFLLVCEVDELIDNLNILLNDLDRLSESPLLFSGAGTPLKRYKLFLRSFFYEFSRFEDLFGYFLLWLEQLGEISKKDRKAMRAEFYEHLKPMVVIRNTMLHNSFDWNKTLPVDVFLLEGADHSGHRLVRKSDGVEVNWKILLSPICVNSRNILFTAAADMRTFWSTVVADHTYFLVKKGTL